MFSGKKWPNLKVVACKLQAGVTKIRVKVAKIFYALFPHVLVQVRIYPGETFSFPFFLLHFTFWKCFTTFCYLKTKIRVKVAKIFYALFPHVLVQVRIFPGETFSFPFFLLHFTFWKCFTTFSYLKLQK